MIGNLFCNGNGLDLTVCQYLRCRACIIHVTAQLLRQGSRREGVHVLWCDPLQEKDINSSTPVNSHSHASQLSSDHRNKPINEILLLTMTMIHTTHLPKNRSLDWHSPTKAVQAGVRVAVRCLEAVDEVSEHLVEEVKKLAAGAICNGRAGEYLNCPASPYVPGGMVKALCSRSGGRKEGRNL